MKEAGVVVAGGSFSADGLPFAIAAVAAVRPPLH